MARLAGTVWRLIMPTIGLAKPSKNGLIPVPDQSETAEGQVGLQPKCAVTSLM